MCVGYSREGESDMSEDQTWRQQLKGVRAFTETLKEPERATIAGNFAEALGCIENSLYWLRRVNEQYDVEQDADDIRFCNPAMDFWLQAEQAEDAVKRILDKLQRVEPLAPNTFGCPTEKEVKA